MLKKIDPLLTPELLYVLATMGHGDDLVVADANFPSDSVAQRTTHRRVVRLAGVDTPGAVRAILSVYPLDEAVDEPVRRMMVEGHPDEIPPVQRELQAVVDAAAGRRQPMGGVERFAFYEAARSAYAVVATGERRFWGCMLLKKGVVAPDE
jgi:L-fucose mutarotase